ncbi:MAG: tetratricopeptide repeat protein [Vicinamibacterales bacterium]
MHCRSFERELSSEAKGHLYARECCANTWYAIGALGLRHGHTADAVAAFDEAVQRVPHHPMARLGLALATRRPDSPPVPVDVQARGRGASIEAVLCIAAGHVFRGSDADAAQLVEETLLGAVPGNAAWLLPIEPLLNVVAAAPGVWVSTLACLRTRAV